ncbi:NUDIX domain-containing protein [Streptomyces sp. NPDC054784]
MPQPPRPDARDLPSTARHPLANGTAVRLVAAVIVHDRERRRIVLLRRGPDARFAPGLWDLPLGKQEPGEPLTATAVRELREETGLSADPGALRLAHVTHAARGVDAPDGFLQTVFVTHTWSGEPVNTEPEKHTRVCWTPEDALPDAFVPSSRTALAAYLGGGAPRFTEQGWG